jgi:hypothetical protein
MAILLEFGVVGLALLAIAFSQLIGGIILVVGGALSASKDPRSDSTLSVGASGVNASVKGSPKLAIAIVGLLIVIAALFFGNH